MPTAQRDGEIHVELYVRSELPPPARDQADTVYRRLSDLVDEGSIASVDRTEWVKRTPVDGCVGDLRDRYLAFTTWASEMDVRLTPFFQTRECFSPAHGETRDWLVLPAFCLAIYRDEDLSAVYPHADETDTMTVEDGVRALERDAVRVVGQSPAAAD